MSCLMRLLPLLAAAPLLCTSFAPNNPSITRASISTQYHHHHALQATQNENEVLERVGKVAGTAFLALTLSFSSITAPAPFSDALPSTVPSANAMSSITIAARTKSPAISEDETAIQSLERETREIEREAKADERKAKVEKSREAFYEYEAKMAELDEVRIEAAEKKAEVEFEKDKELAEKLKAEEQQAEREAGLATTKEEKAAKQKEAKALLAREKEVERKEERALRAEKVFLAEEQYEQKIVKQKEDAARAEEAKFEAVEKEYETAAELAKEDEAELKLFKDMFRKK